MARAAAAGAAAVTGGALRCHGLGPGAPDVRRRAAARPGRSSGPALRGPGAGLGSLSGPLGPRARRP